MRTTQNRLAAMEAKLMPKAGPRRVYVVTGGGVDDDPANFVRAQGFECDDDADLVLHLVGYAPSPDGAVRVTGPFGWVGRPPERSRAA